MKPQPLIEETVAKTPEGIWFESQMKAERDNNECLIYTIPGNPCLMTYYEPFLSTPFTLLDSGASSRNFATRVGGYTLPGFESLPSSKTNGITLPASLRSQIKNTEELTKVSLGNRVDQSGDNKNAQAPKVILIAHSIGAYIALEMLRRRAQGKNDLSNAGIVGAVLICPTVVDIAKSTQGAIMNRVQRIPSFPAIMGAFARFVTFCLPLWALHWLIAFFGRVPRHIAQANAEFLKSPWGVQQALLMQKDGIHEIKEDTWDEAIWGSPDGSYPTPVSLKFYFAHNDVWVSSRVRDALITSRGRSSNSMAPSDLWKPEMIIDENRVPHAFIIDHSELIAEKVKDLIEDILADKGR